MMPVRRSAHGAHGLAASYYHDPAVFETETDRIFDRHWLCAGRATQAAVPGDWFVQRIESEDVLVIRGADGQLRAFANVCLHRGTRLCDAEAGHDRARLTCPYHGWSYDLEGVLQAAPHALDEERAIIGELQLHEFPLAEWAGFVFVCLGEPAKSLDEFLAPVRSRFDAWSLADLVPAARVTDRVPANWKLLFQNYNECYHCPRVHPELSRFTPFTSASNEFEEGAILGGPMEIGPDAQSLTTDGKYAGPPFPRLAAEDAGRVYFFTIFPSLWLSPHPDFVLVHYLFRESPDVTRVICEWLFLPEVVQQPDFDPAPAVGLWEKTNRQDWEMCRRAHEGTRSRAFRPGPYLGLETITAAFDRHYLDAMAPGR